MDKSPGLAMAPVKRSWQVMPHGDEVAAPAGCLSLGAGGQSRHRWSWGCSIGNMIPGSLHILLLAYPDPNRDPPGQAEAPPATPTLPRSPRDLGGPFSVRVKAGSDQPSRSGSEVASHRDANPAPDISSYSKASGNTDHSTRCYRAP